MEKLTYIQDSQVCKVTMVQFFLTCLLSAFGVFFDINYAVSVFFGGMVFIIPNVVMVWSIFRYKGARVAKKIVSSFYKGVAVKFCLTVLLFSLIFKFYVEIQPIYFFLTFILIQGSNWLVPMVIRKRCLN